MRDAVAFVRALIERRDRLSPREVLLASTDGATTHREIFEAATVAHFGEHVRPILVPRPLCRAGLWVMDAVGRGLGAPAFERPWMGRFIDLELAVDARLTRERLNARELLSGQDVVIDGSDNFATRYVVNDSCVALGIPYVHGAVFRFEGQVSVFWPARPGDAGPCYRCLYPEPPPAELAPSCAEAGVLGVVHGIIGLLQAAETLRLLLGAGVPLVGRMLHYDGLRGRFDEFAVPRDPRCPACAH